MQHPLLDQEAQAGGGKPAPARPSKIGAPPPVSQKVVQADRQGRFSDKLYKNGLVAAMILLLLLVSFSQRRLNSARDHLGLTRVAPLENAPPVLAFTTVALGGFRGLIANALWLRMTDLQENDKYFEMVQLADWITKLQPHIVTVWAHQAWNMSYNISVKFNDPADRWQWVKRGIELLRDEALKYNPNEVLIYRELAWHFQHKMGADLDDAHFFYKYTWAHEMDKVFGRAAVNWDELLNPQTPEAKERVRLLREKYKMNPRWMKEVDEKYGPLEWHLPESHAIYWAYLALEKADKSKLKKDDLIQCRRVIFQSLQLAFRRGRIIYPDKTSDKFIYGPNLDIVPQADKAYLQMMDQEPTMRDNIANAHKHFLEWAVYYLYLYGRTNQSEYWWKELRERYPDAVPKGTSIKDYALSRAQETIHETSHDDSKAFIEGFIRTGFYYLAIEDDPAASENYFKFAQIVHDRFNENVGKSINRVALPPVAQIKREVLNELLKGDPAFAAQLRTRLNLPAGTTEILVAPETNPAGASTNAPPAKAAQAK